MFKITEISPQQKGSLLNVFVNGEYAFSADSGFIVDEDIFVGKLLDDGAFTALKTAAGVRKAMRHALFLLEHRDFSKKELATRLEEKGYEEDFAVAAAEKISAMGYIDDRRYAERLVERKKNKVGEQQIRYELSKAGISREDADDILAEMYDESSDGVAVVLKEMRRKLKGEIPDDRKAQAKLFNSFRAKGFTFETVKAAYEKYCENEDLPID